MESKSRPFLVLAGLIALGVGGGISHSLLAQDSPAAPGAKGRQIAADQCADCHGLDGMATAPEYPHLAGQFPGYISSALDAYKAKTREGDIMREIAAGLSASDIADVASYYAELPPFSAAPGSEDLKSQSNLDEDPLANARAMAAGCGGCHGADGNTQMPGVPALAGQSMPYLIDVTKSYRDGERGEGIMKNVVAGLDNGTIEEIAYFYAVQNPESSGNSNGGDEFGGRASVANCVSCHGPDGNKSNNTTPRLAGIDAQYLATALRAYRDGTRSNAVMKDAVAGLRDAEIDNIAAFYATKIPNPSHVARPLTTAQWVERCARCHSVNGSSTDERFPIIAGQSEAYLVAALKHYHLNERPSSMMYAMSFNMRESDIKKLAAYYAGQREAN